MTLPPSLVELRRTGRQSALRAKFDLFLNQNQNFRRARTVHANIDTSEIKTHPWIARFSAEKDIALFRLPVDLSSRVKSTAGVAAQWPRR